METKKDSPVERAHVVRMREFLKTLKENGMKQCLVPGCLQPANAAFRGLCMGHYSESKRLVETGKTTWEELEAQGLATPKGGGAVEGALRRAKGGE